MSSKKPTIVDIAKALNVTPSTVSKAFSDHPRISQKTKDAVWAKAKELSYRPNFFATALRRGRSFLIGVVVPQIDNSFFSSAVKGIEHVADASGYRVIITQSNDQAQREEAMVEALLNLHVDGIIVSVGSRTQQYQHFERIIKKKIPLIFFDRVIDELPVSCVCVDDYQGAFEATRHLIQQGARNILHLAGQPQVPIFAQRIAGYQAALRDADIKLSPDWMQSSDLTVDDGRAIMQAWLAKHELPDAIFAARDAAAVGAIQVLRESGIAVPEQVAIVGFSDEPYARFVSPQLSSMQQHSFEQGNLAAEMLLEQIEQGADIPRRREVLKPELIVRQSSGLLLEKTGAARKGR